jgi:hypothetical protein
VRAIDTADIRLPSTAELIEASALLRGHSDLAKRSYAEEIAIAEYCHYTTQTYVFETVGFQLLGEMTAKLRRFDFVHDLSVQAQDEAMHARIYRDVVAGLPVRLLPESFEMQAEPIYAAFVARGTVEEKVVTAYFVLESIGIGIFAARHRFYRSSPLVALDHQILADEAEHQGMGVRLTADLVRDGRLRLSEVTDIVREAATTVSRVLTPTALFERFDLGDSPAERERVLSSGILEVQRVTSQKAMGSALRRLRRELGQGVHASQETRGTRATAA